MRSKAYHAFKDKLEKFRDDIELMDVLRENVIGNTLTDANSGFVLKLVDANRHKHLARRRNSSGSRDLIIGHLRKSIYSSYFKDVYEEVTLYLRTILEKAAQKGTDPNRVIGEHPIKMDARAILALGSWDKVCEAVAENLFQCLEAEKSTLKLLQKMATKLALTIPATLITDAIPYLELRHFLIHADGKLSPEYIQSFPFIRHKQGYVVLDYTIVGALEEKVKALVLAYDKEVIAHSLLLPRDIGT